MSTKAETSTTPPRRSSASTQTVHGETPATVLHLDHEVFDRLAESILGSVIAGDRQEAANAITGLQWKVLAHLEEEERSIFPAYARHAPAEATILMEDHARIRRALADLDVTTDLHLLRADNVRTFLTALRAHATRENEGLYLWTATQQSF